MAGAGTAEAQRLAGDGVAQANADKTIASVLGEIVWLMSQSPEDKEYRIADLEWLVMPPILLRQFRIFYAEGKPVAVVLYARVSEEVEQRLEAGTPMLNPAEWASGARVTIVRTVAPFGGREDFEKETRATATSPTDLVRRRIASSPVAPAQAKQR